MHSSNIHIKIFTQLIITSVLILFLTSNSLFAQSREVVAKNGDGIYKILRNNGLDPEKYIEAFIELNKTRLGKDNTLFIGVKYRLPDVDSKTSEPAVSVNTEIAASTSVPATTKPATNPTGKTMRYDIFGPKYANVEIKSNELKGAVYYLKSGHGGPDPGAMGNYQGNVVCEDEYAYDVTLRLAKNLIERGATVYMITIDKNDGIRDVSFLKADKDEVCYPNLTIPLNHVKRLQQRVNAVNNLYGKHKNSFQRFISIHVDSRSKGENIDLFFYHDAKSKTGKKAATTLQKTFHAKYNEHQPGRGYQGTVSARNLYVLKNSYPVGVYIELANMNHQRDIKRLIIADNRQAVANWLADGLVTDFKTNK
ncbi:MAG: N-acetylmuramoyl-L-alanine amidase [Bacteroidetes bacterium]|nr:MAG: N-acetylmuramoyl-L-alanine amidase [Bacteroidota bacterium]